MIFNLYKNRGETPLECLERFRATKPELENESMTYLGRLDPLAEGVLLVGTEEHAEQKEREKFFGLDKEYEFSVIFGFATDTYDVMGEIISPLTPLTLRGEQNIRAEISEMDLIKLCKIYEGEREQKYPEYSAKMIAKRKAPPQPSPKGREQDTSLLWRGDGGEAKKITIYNLQFKKLETLSKKELFGRILMDIGRVKGDFRQVEILELWKKCLIDGLDTSPQLRGGRDEVRVGFFSAHVSSGTYIRSLVNDMGASLGCGATTLSIKRTRVGDYKIEDSIKF